VNQKFDLRKVVIGLIWAGFTTYILWLAPLDQPETLPIVRNLLLFQLSEVNSYLVAIFWLMGVWPMIYACLMFIDARMQGLPASLYFVAANATGIIGLAPYLMLRQRHQAFWGKKDKWLQVLDSHSTGIFLSLATIGLISYALLSGDLQDFVHQWRSVSFVHLITLEFCFMGLLFPLSSLLEDDMARRGLKDARVFWGVALLPLFSPLAYLCLRSPLKEGDSPSSQS
jgi:hypothetical protein